MVDYAILISGQALEGIGGALDFISVWHLVAAGAVMVVLVVLATR